jgi:predicted transcriptional regulator
MKSEFVSTVAHDSRCPSIWWSALDDARHDMKENLSATQLKLIEFIRNGGPGSIR